MNRIAKWAKRGVWLTLAAVLTIGCNPLQTVAFLFPADRKAPAQYPLRPKDGPKHEKDQELKVLVVCHQGSNIPYEFAGAYRELATQLAQTIPDLAKENKEKITVIPPSQFEDYRLKNPRCLSGSEPMSQIGKALGADVVVEIYLKHVSIYQPGSLNKLYDGRAECEVGVYDVTTGTKSAKYSYPYPYSYRPNHTPDVDSVPLASYRQGFLNRLALELAWKHVDHLPSDGIAAGNP